MQKAALFFDFNNAKSYFVFDFDFFLNGMMHVNKLLGDIHKHKHNLVNGRRTDSETREQTVKAKEHEDAQSSQVRSKQDKDNSLENIKFQQLPYVHGKKLTNWLDDRHAKPH